VPLGAAEQLTVLRWYPILGPPSGESPAWSEPPLRWKEVSVPELSVLVVFVAAALALLVPPGPATPADVRSRPLPPDARSRRT
jgi:hypothetical protein